VGEAIELDYFRHCGYIYFRYMYLLSEYESPQSHHWLLEFSFTRGFICFNTPANLAVLRFEFGGYAGFSFSDTEFSPFGIRMKIPHKFA
jgi:hypothetical protein